MDEAFEKELRRLGKTYDITIISYGISSEKLDNLPSANEILKMESDKIEIILSEEKTIITAIGKDYLDWEYINQFLMENSDFQALIEWLPYAENPKLFNHKSYETFLKSEKNP